MFLREKKENVGTRVELNSGRVVLECQHGRRYVTSIAVFWSYLVTAVKVTCPLKVPITIGICSHAQRASVRRSCFPPHSILPKQVMSHDDLFW